MPATCPEPQLCGRLGWHVHGRHYELWLTDSRFRARWLDRARAEGRDVDSILMPGEVARPACRHLGGVTGKLVDCAECVSAKLKVFGCAAYGECVKDKSAAGVQSCKRCPSYAPPPPPDLTPGSTSPFSLVTPLGTPDSQPRYEGRIAKKPWDYRVTACVPHLDTLEPLRVCLELLRLQTERPYLIVVDTGSPPGVVEELQKLRADDLEIHSVAGHAYRHSSEPVCVALDLAQALCRSEYLFHTHTDLFLRRRDFLEEIVGKCGPDSPAVGYRMSPRDWATDEWSRRLGHSVLVTHMPTVHRIGATWSHQRAHHAFGYPWVSQPGWPDTETGWGRCLEDAGVIPVFIGDDRNFQRQIDDNLDHVRSYPGAKVYGADRYRQAQPEMEAALAEAYGRIREWRGEAYGRA